MTIKHVKNVLTVLLLVVSLLAYNLAEAAYPRAYHRGYLTDDSDSSNLWDSLKSGFQLNHYKNSPQVQAQIAWYMRNQGYLYRTSIRAAPYMYYIYQQVKQRNLPTELVLLPILESAYNPFASSNRGAAGLWQLERGTASQFGVKQDFWYDGRRDVLASTNAALDYLTYLQSFFGGNWMLAIAAYDAGEGSVQEAVHRNARDGLSISFWSLSLPQETRAYIPRLLALAVIIENPSEYGIKLPAISNSPYLGAVDIGGQINLSEVANFAGISLGQLKQLNPGFSHHTTDPVGPHKLLLPFDTIQTFQENLIRFSKVPSSSWVHYKVHRGESIESIARNFNTSVDILQIVNHLHSRMLPTGKKLLIPQAAANKLRTAYVENNAVGSAPTLAYNTISATNNAGENGTVASDAETNNNSAATTTKNTATNNGVDNNNAANNINTNMNSSATNENIASNTATMENSENAAVMPLASLSKEKTKEIHIIRSGETLQSIAKHYKVSVTDLRRWNKIANTHKLKPGSKIIIVYNYRINVAAATAQPVSVVTPPRQHNKHNAVVKKVKKQTQPKKTTIKPINNAINNTINNTTNNHIKKNINTVAVNTTNTQPKNTNNAQPVNTINTQPVSAINSQAMSTNNAQPRNIISSQPKKTAKKMLIKQKAVPTHLAHYTIHQGDNLISIAHHYHVQAADIKKWNHLRKNEILHNGSVLIIYY